MSQRFQIDLGGIVELLSKSLYSGPHVYLREVIQNGVDAITARRALDPTAPARIRIIPGYAALAVTDTGVGLTATQAEEFLATIGRSSKRDELFGEGRAEYLGQFGIGLLSCFLIADTVEVISRSATPGATPIRWVGHSNGTFDVQELTGEPTTKTMDLDGVGNGAGNAESTGERAGNADRSGELAGNAGGAGTLRFPGIAADDVLPDITNPARIPVGTTIYLKARPDEEHWVSHISVVESASDFAGLLDMDVAVRLPLPGGDEVWRAIASAPVAVTPQKDDGAPSRNASSSDSTPGSTVQDARTPEATPGTAPHTATSGTAPHTATPNDTTPGMVTDGPPDPGTFANPFTPPDEAVGSLPPWDPACPHRLRADFCRRKLGFVPMAAIPFSVPLTGTEGVAYVLPQAVSPGAGRHRVYAKRMLVSVREDAILPEWAFFVRAVVNTEGLGLTASREQLRHDGMLTLTREEIGVQLREWIYDTLSDFSTLGQQFIRTHHLALRAMALENDDMIELVASTLPYETSQGPMTLEAVRDECQEVIYTRTTEAYKAVAPVLSARGLIVVNGGYVYDAELLQRLGQLPGWDVREMRAADVKQATDAVVADPDTQDGLDRVADVLERFDVNVELGAFDPSHVPAILVVDDDATRTQEMRRERDETDDMWAGLLDNFLAPQSEDNEPEDPSTVLVLNDNNDVVHSILECEDPAALEDIVPAVFCSALLYSGQALHAGETRIVNESLNALIRRALH